MNTSKLSRERIEDATRMLSGILHDGDKIYCIITHVSRSGMLRRVRLFCVENNQPIDISGWVAVALGRTRSPADGGINMAGCQYDVGVELVSALSDKFKVRLDREWL